VLIRDQIRGQIYYLQKIKSVFLFFPVIIRVICGQIRGLKR